MSHYISATEAALGWGVGVEVLVEGPAALTCQVAPVVTGLLGQSASTPSVKIYIYPVILKLCSLSRIADIAIYILL